MEPSSETCSSRENEVGSGDSKQKQALPSGFLLNVIPESSLSGNLLGGQRVVETTHKWDYNYNLNSCPANWPCLGDLNDFKAQLEEVVAKGSCAPMPYPILPIFPRIGGVRNENDIFLVQPKTSATGTCWTGYSEPRGLACFSGFWLYSTA